MRQRAARLLRAAFACPFFGLVLVLTIANGQALANDGSAVPWRASFEQAQDEALTRNRPLWVQFTGPWCLYCRRMEREVFSRPDVGAMGHSEFVPVKIRSDEREDLATRYGVTALPFTVIVDVEGHVLARHEGFADPGTFLTLLNRARPTPVLALDGYCPVSLVEGEGLKSGLPDLTVMHDGMIFRFASAESRETFLENPERYLPSSSGRCVVNLVDRGAR